MNDIFSLDPVGITLLEESRRILTNQLTLLPRQEHFIEENGRTLIGDRWVKDILALVRREGAFFPLRIKANPDGGLVQWSAGEFDIEVRRYSYTISLHQGDALLFHVNNTGVVEADWLEIQSAGASLYKQDRSTYNAYKAWLTILTKEVPAANFVDLFTEIEQLYGARAR